MAKQSGPNSLVVGGGIVILVVGAIIMLSQFNTTVAPEKDTQNAITQAPAGENAPSHPRGDTEGQNGLIEGDTNGKPMVGVDITIQNFAYSRPTFTVKKGTSVTWQNEDTVAHTVTADDGSFDSGLLEKGKTFSHTFDTAGTFEYHCTPHPQMTAKIVVE